MSLYPKVETEDGRPAEIVVDADWDDTSFVTLEFQATDSEDGEELGVYYIDTEQLDILIQDLQQHKIKLADLIEKRGK